MRRAALVLGLFLGLAFLARAADGRILKVLPHFLDEQGRHALAPSLYERDAYQAELRKQPQRVSGLRFDVNWRVRGSAGSPLRLRLELRTAGRPEAPPVVIESAVKRGAFGRSWTAVPFTGEAYREAGSVLAWRATLIEGDREIATKQSFLW